MSKENNSKKYHHNFSEHCKMFINIATLKFKSPRCPYLHVKSRCSFNSIMAILITIINPSVYGYCLWILFWSLTWLVTYKWHFKNIVMKSCFFFFYFELFYLANLTQLWQISNITLPRYLPEKGWVLNLLHNSVIMLININLSI